MLISESFLRSIIFESLLFEGFMDDQNMLAEMYPEQKDKILSFDEKESRWIAWLTARFGRNATIKETHPFEEAIESVTSFSKVFNSVTAKWKSNEIFRKDVENFLPDRSWKKYDITPQIISLLTSDEMEVLKGLATRAKQNFKINISEEDLESDRVGKVGPWNLWMPTTREHSCKIAQYDPVTLKPKTTWCTARMAGSNLFYNYIGQPGREITLFYIIKDKPSKPNDWLSVGFVNGKPVLGGVRGSVSVNRDNFGLTEKKLMAALGPYHDQIMIALTQKNKSLDGKHPARAKIIDAAKSIEAFNSLTAGLSQSESADIINTILREPDVSVEVLTKIAQNQDPNIRRAVADKDSTQAAVFFILAKDKDPLIIRGVVRNASAPAEVLIDLAGSGDEITRLNIASNPNAPSSALDVIVSNNGASPFELKNAAENPNVSNETLKILVNNKDFMVRRAATSALNQRKKSLSEQLLRRLVMQMM